MIRLLSDTIDRAAEHTPDRDAFRCRSSALTYGELVTASNRLAQLLVEQGVQKGDRVGIYMPRCLESAVAVYGIMKAGAACVPIDPNMPATRVQQLIADCDIRHLTTHKSRKKSFVEILDEDSCLESIIGTTIEHEGSVRTLPWETLDQFPAHYAPAESVSDDDLAYIMYTSGSTGQPKGIMHTHEGGLSYAKLSVQTYEVTSEDRIANHSPLHFDMSTFGYFSSPYAGATTVLIPEAYTKLPASLSQLMQDERISIWYSVPYALIQLLLRGVTEQRDLNSLRWILFGGEPFPAKHLRSLMEKWQHARFSNVYGPAEVNQCTFYHVPSPADDASTWNDGNIDEQSIPIGQVWDETEALVLDDEDESIAPGQSGELLIHSSTMMQGYWNRPDLTSAAFYQHSTTSGATKTFYRTGDLVRMQDDGNYQFLGRKDRQIKARGHRVELDEIEAALASHSDVEEAAVFPVKDDEGTNEICAAVTTKSESAVNETDLTAWLKQRLPWYATPSSITLKRSMPRTATGKIHRRQLQEQASSTSSAIATPGIQSD